MSNSTKYSASIRILEINLADTLQEIFEGKNLPIEKKITAPRPGGLCEGIIEAIGERADVDKDDLFAKHTLTLFAGGEQKIEYDSTVAGRKVFVILDFPPLDDTRVSREFFRLASALTTTNYMFLAQLAADAARRSRASEVHLLMPNFAYARQDKTHKKRGPISADVTAGNLERYYDTVTSLHLHSPAIEGMMSPGALGNISPNEVFAPSFVCRDPDTLKPIAPEELTLAKVNKLFSRVCIVSPDVGGTANARDFAKYCKTFAATLLRAGEEEIVDIPMANIDKRRTKANDSEVMNVLGRENVRGRTAILFDDMGDTFGTAIHAADALMDKKTGARGVEFWGTHGYFSGNALDRLAASKISLVKVTNSMALRPGVVQHPMTSVVNIAPVLAQVIADLTTEAKPNLRFHNRHTQSEEFQHVLGRFVGPMMSASAPQP